MAVPAWLAAAPALNGAQPSGQVLAQASAPGATAGSQALTMNNPDSGAVYRIDPGLPLDAQQIEISAWPGANVRLSEVRLLVDGRPLAWLEAAPYSITWKLEPGLHIFSAEGVTTDGDRVTSNQVRVEVRE